MFRTRSTTDQPMLPRTLRDRLANRLQRGPVSFIANWDHMKAPSLTPYDPEAAWTELEAQIRRLPVDEGHGDVADRLVTEYHAQFAAQAELEAVEREEKAERILNQGREHFIKVQEKVGALREAVARHRQQYDEAWQELTGQDPASAPRPIADAVVPLPLPDAKGAEPDVQLEADAGPLAGLKPLPADLHQIREAEQAESVLNEVQRVRG